MKSLVFVVVAIFSLLELGKANSTLRTFTCPEIRRLAAVYGVPALLQYARGNGYSEKQIALYKKCLKKGKKHG